MTTFLIIFILLTIVGGYFFDVAFSLAGKRCAFGDDNPSAYHILSAQNEVAAGKACPAWIDFNTSNYTVPSDAWDTVTYYSRDPDFQKPLVAWFINASTGNTEAPIVVHSHGVTACKQKYESVFPAAILWRNGISSLLIDYRNHGESPADNNYATFGYKEHLDALGGVDWALAQGIPFERIGLQGVSHGGSTTLVAFGVEKRLTRAWVDSAVFDVDGTIKHGGVKMVGSGLTAVLYPFLKVAAPSKSKYGAPVWPLDPLSECRHMAGRKLFVVADTADDVVPYEINAAVGEKALRSSGALVETWTTDTCEPFLKGENSCFAHVKSMLCEPDTYEEKLAAFWTPLKLE